MSNIVYGIISLYGLLVGLNLIINGEGFLVVTLGAFMFLGAIITIYGFIMLYYLKQEKPSKKKSTKKRKK